MPRRECRHCSRQALRYFFFFSLSWASNTLWGVLGSLGLCINVRNTDVNYAVSPANPKSLYQDIATVFRAIVLKEALDGMAFSLLGVGQNINPSKVK
jgi:hypothetical protein